ncbi:hypothetical protein FHS63_003139 [Azospirillum doebereinerae]
MIPAFARAPGRDQDHTSRFRPRLKTGYFVSVLTGLAMLAICFCNSSICF